MMKWHRQERLVAFVFGLLGVFVGAGLMYWGKLPAHTIDLLTFTESAFGIGMTVLALLFVLGLLRYRAEVETLFEPRSNSIETRTEKALHVMGERMERLEKTYGDAVPARAAAASGVLMKKRLLPQKDVPVARFPDEARLNKPRQGKVFAGLSTWSNGKVFAGLSIGPAEKCFRGTHHLAHPHNK